MAEIVPRDEEKSSFVVREKTLGRHKHVEKKNRYVGGKCSGFHLKSPESFCNVDSMHGWACCTKKSRRWWVSSYLVQNMHSLPDSKVGQQVCRAELITVMTNVERGIQPDRVTDKVLSWRRGGLWKVMEVTCRSARIDIDEVDDATMLHELFSSGICLSVHWNLAGKVGSRC